jgi:hypothetical protein
VRHDEDDDAAREPSDGDRPEAEEVLLEHPLSEHAGDDGRQDRGEKGHGQPSAARVAAGDAPHHAPKAARVEHEDGEDGAKLDDDDVGVCGVLAFDGVREAERMGRQQEMPGGADREVLGDALDDPQYDRIVE